MKTYLFVFSGSLLLAMALTLVVILFAHRFSMAQSPNVRSVHRHPTARIGGIAIFLSMMMLVVPVLFVQNRIGDSFRNILPQIIALLAGATLMFLTGLIDDLKGMRARYKLLAQLTAAGLVCSFGIRITHFTVQGLFSIQFPPILQWSITMFWLVGITNAVNLIDGLDGLAAGISAITCAVIAVLAVHSGSPVMAILMLSLLGSLLGFLFFNFNPAKIFMGDCGSLFLGFTLAASSVLCATKSSALVGLAVPVLALGIPIFDTLFSMLRRFLERRSMFAPDFGHFHHRLLDYGLKQHHVAIIAYVITTVVAGFGLFIIYTRSVGSVAVFASLLLIIVLIFHLAGSIRLRATLDAIRSRYSVNGEIKDELRTFEEVQLHFKNAQTFDQWWQTVCSAAEQMDFDSISLPLTNRDGSQRILEWKADNSAVKLAEGVPNPLDLTPKTCPSTFDLSPDISNQIIHTSLPIKDRRTGSSLRLIIDIPANGSLESAGRRATLFTRLMEEHGIADL